MTKLSEFLKVT